MTTYYERFEENGVAVKARIIVEQKDIVQTKVSSKESIISRLQKTTHPQTLHKHHEQEYRTPMISRNATTIPIMICRSLLQYEPPRRIWEIGKS